MGKRRRTAVAESVVVFVIRLLLYLGVTASRAIDKGKALGTGMKSTVDVCDTACASSG